MKTLFFGSSSYCLPLCASLHKNTDLLGIVTRPNSTFGRNKEIIESPLKSYAKSNQIKYFTPSSKEELIGLIDVLKSLKSDIAVVADYGLIIPSKVFNIPKFKTINVHFGKLPEYRGASPLQWSIAKGEKNIPISIILMDEGLDTGDIITEINYLTQGDKTSGELYPQLFNDTADHLPEIIEDFTKGNLKPHEQSDKNIFVTQRLTREDGFIPWEVFINTVNNTLSSLRRQGSMIGNQNSLIDSRLRGNDKTFSPISQSAFTHSSIPALSIFNLYRALSPWPGLWTTFEMQQFNNETMKQKKRLKILKLYLEPLTFNLLPEMVQLEGKKPVSWEQFKEAYLPLNKPDQDKNHHNSK